MGKENKYIFGSILSLVLVLLYVFMFYFTDDKQGGLITLGSIITVFLTSIWIKLTKNSLQDTSVKQFFTDYFASIEVFLVFIFLIILPFIFTKTLIDGALRSRLLALSVITSILSIAFIYRVYKGMFSLRFSKTDKFIFGALFLFVIINLISAKNNVTNPTEATVAFFKEFLLATTFFLIYQLLRNEPKAKDIIVKGFILMTLIYIGMALEQLLQADFTEYKQANDHYGYYLRQAVSKVTSTLSSVNPFTSFLFLSLAFSGYGIIKFNRLWKFVSIISSAGALFFIILLASKAAWGAFGILVLTAFILFYLYLIKIRPKTSAKKLPIYSKVLIILLPFLIIAGGIYITQRTNLQIVNVTKDKVQQVLNPELCLNDIYNSDKPTSTQTRTLVWANTLQMVRENPILGVGPGQWRINYAKYGLDGFEYDIRNGSKHFQRPHNDFLWIMSESGILAFMLFIIIYLTILVSSIAIFFSEKDIKNRLVNVIFFGTLLGFILILFVSFPRERITHNISYLLIFSLVLSSIKIPEKSNSQKKHLTVFVFIALAIPIVFNLKVSHELYKSEKIARKIQFGLRRKNNNQVYNAASKIKDSYFSLDNFSSPIYYYYGSMQSAILKDPNLAKQSFIEARKLNPYHLQVINNLATSYDLTGDKKTAIKIYNEALAISPRYNEALINKSIVYYNLNDLEKSFEIIKKIPAKEKHPKKYKNTVVTICRKKSLQVIDKVDKEKFSTWFRDENEVFNTYLTANKKNIDFNNYLIKIIGK